MRGEAVKVASLFKQPSEHEDKPSLDIAELRLRRALCCKMIDEHGGAELLPTGY